MAKTFSDSPTEDKGYNRNHRQTKGGEQAYLRGEKPLTYWSKKEIMQELSQTLRSLQGTSEYNKIVKVMKTYNLTLTQIVMQVQRQKLDVLKNSVLEIKGHHYTGNYYQYTHFYGLKDTDDLIKAIRPFLEPKPTAVQLKILPIETC